MAGEETLETLLELWSVSGSYNGFHQTFSSAPKLNIG